MEQEWFENPSWWFNANDKIDEYLSIKYGYLIDDNYNNLDNFGKILVYDQLVRHVYRKEHANHIILWFLQKALALSINIPEYELDALDDQRFCFALLPLRHSGEAEYIYKCMQLAWKRNDSQIIRRFLKACYERAPLVGASLRPSLENRDLSSRVFANLSSIIFLPDLNNKTIIISLSGGVDSNVTSILLKEKYQANNKVIALHINYNNRTTADEEEMFVRQWCDRINIECYVRKIHEIKREPCMKRGLRDVYETYTRNVRYQCYKQFGKDAIIVLGHNKDDIVENIFTNIAGKTKYENLDGMTEWSVVDNITFWRPLLQISKDQIYKLARDNNLQHLPTSTPPWSMRGQIRAAVVPALNKWNPNFVPSLHDLSTTLNDLYNIMKINIEKIVSTVSIKDGGREFEMLAAWPISMVFWRCFFTALKLTPSVASLKNLCDRLQRFDNKKDHTITVVLKKGITLHFHGKILRLDNK